MLRFSGVIIAAIGNMEFVTLKNLTDLIITSESNKQTKILIQSIFKIKVGDKVFHQRMKEVKSFLIYRKSRI